MQVLKRDGTLEPVSLDKITARIQKLCYDLNQNFVEPVEVSKKVVQGLFDGIKTTALDRLASETAASLTGVHYDYSLLAGRIEISNLHKQIKQSFSETVQSIYIQNKEPGLVSKEFYQFVVKNAERLDQAINISQDYTYDYFAFKTLEKSYLLRVQGQIVETPQYMLMRAACQIHLDDVESVLETYKLLSEKWFTHATPTLFNAGSEKPQMSSCFLLQMQEDSIEGIYNTLKQCAKISQAAGGIGLSVHNIRATGSKIHRTNGTSSGLVPMLKVFNDTARYVDQGGNKRKGAFAIYLEPWHSDIEEFLQLKKNHGKEEFRARDLFYGLWIPDLFMKRLLEDKNWSLFCPNECPGLSDSWGEQFEMLYESYEKQGKARKSIPARSLWTMIVQAQVETGTPYLCFKDHANRKSNQQNLGTIKSSNLCTEIIEYTSKDEVAVCNLASIALPRFVTNEQFDYHKLYQVTRIITRNLDKMIDLNWYPLEEARISNLRHRPIGIGVQGLADVFILMRCSFDSEQAGLINKKIFETIYRAAVVESIQMAKEKGAYSTYQGSPAHHGKLQFDLWNEQPLNPNLWEQIKVDLANHGMRNSLLVAPMPTASTSQILGNNECIEPYTSNIYKRGVLSGEYIVVNKHLQQDLVDLGLWNTRVKNQIIANGGSVQQVDEIPQHLKDIYKTVWEIKQKTLIDMAADRGAYVCQSQSLNLFVKDPTLAKLTSMHVYSWKKGLKTGIYYLKVPAAQDAIQFTVEKQEIKQYTEEQALVCSLENPEACEACGS